MTDPLPKIVSPTETPEKEPVMSELSPKSPSPTATGTPDKGPGGSESTSHISQQPWTLSNWYQHIYWPYFTFLVIVPLFGIWQAFSTPLVTKTLVFSVVYYLITGLCITAGTTPFLFHTLNRQVLRTIVQDTTASGPTDRTPPHTR
jgi:stearoyl-CoA desaturase (delta-9 desaturase)